MIKPKPKVSPLMNFDVKKVEKYGQEVFEHEQMDLLRRDHCLCLNCKKMSYCNVAQVLFYVCVKSNMAMAITRCPDWENKKAEVENG